MSTTTVPTIVTGDTISLPVTLKKDSVVFEISSEATVKAAIVSQDHKLAYTDSVTQSEATPGADWANSLVVVEMPATATETVVYQGNAMLEVQVEESGVKTTWFVLVRVVTGQIP